MVGVMHNRRRVRDSVVDDIVHLGEIEEKRGMGKGYWGSYVAEGGTDMCAARDLPNTFSILVFPLLAIHQ